MKSNFFELTQQEQLVVVTMLLEQLSEEDNLDQLDESWTALIEKHHHRAIVLDLSSIRFMTSAAIGRMIGFHRRMTRYQGQLVICSLQPAVAESLETSHLLTYFCVAADLEEAIALTRQTSAN